MDATILFTLPNMGHDISAAESVWSTGITMSKAPVPVRLSLPMTMFPDGVVRSSKSPCSVASDKKAAVVS